METAVLNRQANKLPVHSVKPLGVQERVKTRSDDHPPSLIHNQLVKCKRERIWPKGFKLMNYASYLIFNIKFYIQVLSLRN